MKREKTQKRALSSLVLLLELQTQPEKTSDPRRRSGYCALQGRSRHLSTTFRPLPGGNGPARPSARELFSEAFSTHRPPQDSLLTDAFFLCATSSSSLRRLLLCTPTPRPSSGARLLQHLSLCCLGGSRRRRARTYIGDVRAERGKECVEVRLVVFRRVVRLQVLLLPGLDRLGLLEKTHRAAIPLVLRVALCNSALPRFFSV